MRIGAPKVTKKAPRRKAVKVTTNAPIPVTLPKKKEANVTTK